MVAVIVAHEDRIVGRFAAEKAIDLGRFRFRFVEFAAHIEDDARVARHDLDDGTTDLVLTADDTNAQLSHHAIE